MYVQLTQSKIVAGVLYGYQQQIILLLVQSCPWTVSIMAHLSYVLRTLFTAINSHLSQSLLFSSKRKKYLNGGNCIKVLQILVLCNT